MFGSSKHLNFCDSLEATSLLVVTDNCVQFVVCLQNRTCAQISNMSFCLHKIIHSFPTITETTSSSLLPKLHFIDFSSFKDRILSLA